MTGLVITMPAIFLHDTLLSAEAMKENPSCTKHPWPQGV